MKAFSEGRKPVRGNTSLQEEETKDELDNLLNELSEMLTVPESKVEGAKEIKKQGKTQESSIEAKEVKNESTEDKSDTKEEIFSDRWSHIKMQKLLNVNFPIKTKSVDYFKAIDQVKKHVKMGQDSLNNNRKIGDVISQLETAKYYLDNFQN